LTSIPRRRELGTCTSLLGTIFDQFWQLHTGRLTSVPRRRELGTCTSLLGTIFDQFWQLHTGRLTSVPRGRELGACTSLLGTIFLSFLVARPGRLMSVLREKGTVCLHASPGAVLGLFFGLQVGSWPGRSTIVPLTDALITSGTVLGTSRRLPPVGDCHGDVFRRRLVDSSGIPREGRRGHQLHRHRRSLQSRLGATAAPYGWVRQ